MRAMMILVVTPCRDDTAGMAQRGEQVFIQGRLHPLPSLSMSATIVCFRQLSTVGGAKVRQRPGRLMCRVLHIFQTVRPAMVKAADTSGRSAAERDLAIRQIVNDAVASTEIVDILSAAGLASPDISILSDAFLAEIGQMEKKNLVLEALRKLLNDEIRSRGRSNLIEIQKFSERLEEAIARYHTSAISTVEQRCLGIPPLVMLTNLFRRRFKSLIRGTHSLDGGSGFWADRCFAGAVLRPATRLHIATA